MCWKSPIDNNVMLYNISDSYATISECPDLFLYCAFSFYSYCCQSVQGSHGFKKRRSSSTIDPKEAWVIELDCCHNFVSTGRSRIHRSPLGFVNGP